MTSWFGMVWHGLELGLSMSKLRGPSEMLSYTESYNSRIAKLNPSFSWAEFNLILNFSSHPSTPEIVVIHQEVNTACALK